MEPYREDRPIIRIDTETSMLDRLLNAGIPLTRALKYFRDNPEGSALETLKLAAEDIVPFYGNYRNDGDLRDYAKEAVMLGIPMPYIKHPTTGKPIPNNLKEAFSSPNGYAQVKHKLKKGERNLYADPTAVHMGGTGHRIEGEGLSTSARMNRTFDPSTAVDVPSGPYLRTNTGSGIQSEGRRARGTNTIATTGGHTALKGSFAYQGEMYPPGRTLRKDDMYGPFQWEDKYSRKLNDVIDRNELAWEYMINKTRPVTTGRFKDAVVPKQEIYDIAISQGRPDIAERVMLDDKPRVSANGTELTSFGTQQRHAKLSNYDYKDIGNRQVEKELRETFATLPDDPTLRQRFADYYGVPDLYQDWISNPVLWNQLKEDIIKKRYYREASNRSRDRQYGRTIQR